VHWDGRGTAPVLHNALVVDAAALVGNGLQSRSREARMTFPYLDRPLVPLAVALRSMLAETEAKIASAEPAEKAWLQRRAEVLRERLRPKSTIPIST
jgi:hypothetical protein